MKDPWHFQLFGSLSAKRGDQTITRFSTSRAAALLTRLAMFPHRIHPREELIDLLWPASHIDSGRLNLRVALASLRRQLEPPDVLAGSVLIADRSSIRLNSPACRTDVTEFETALKAAAHAPDNQAKRAALEEALGLYTGELLPGFYDEWIIEERERLCALSEEAEERFQALPAAAITDRLVADRTTEMPGLGKREICSLHGFPMQFTRFFGRELQFQDIIKNLRFPGMRLLTLTGPGGAGKTRMAVETAHRIAADFPGQIYFVPLFDLAASNFLLGAISDALGLTAATEVEPLERIVTFLTGQPPALLVLDNFEHLVEGGAPLLLSLLTRLPSLTCLVTSRRRLALPSECEYPVPPLPLPAKGGTAAEISRAASAQLFVNRAQAARPDFQLTSNNSAAVAELCHKMEGIPLAIELIAARAPVLSPTQMLERLDHRFDLLVSRRGDKTGRHRSLWAAIAWSYDLLTPNLQSFFNQLSVFRGGFTVESAQEVCEEPQAVELLTQLRERSLIVTEEIGTGMRFRLLETLREFAVEQLDPEQQQVIRCRHALYLMGLAEKLQPQWKTSKQGEALTLLDAESDNLRVALAYCTGDLEEVETGEPVWGRCETGLRLAGALGNYWTIRGQLREGLEWLESALAFGGCGLTRATALAEAGWMHAGLGRYAVARTILTEALGICRDLGDRAALAAALRKRGVAALWQGENALAAADLEESLVLCRELGDDAGAASALNSLGVLEDEWRLNKAAARVLYLEAIALFRKCGDRRWESYCLHNLGNICHSFGDNDQAEILLRQSLDLADSLGDLWQRAYCLRSLGDVQKARGDFAGAIVLLSDGRALCGKLGDRMSEAGNICSLGMIARRQNLPIKAVCLFYDALRLYRDMDHNHGVALCLLDLVEIAAESGRWEYAACLLASKDAACASALLAEETRARFAAVRGSVYTALGEVAFETASEPGHGHTLGDCAAFALGGKI